MTRNKDVLLATHVLAISIILVLSLSIITYPIGFLASADTGTSGNESGRLGGLAIRNNALSNTGVIRTPDDSGTAQPGIVDSPDAVPNSDSSSPPDSSTDSSGSTSSDSSSPPDSSTDSSVEGSTTTTDSSGATPTDGTVSTGNDSATAEVSEGSGTVDSIGAVGNETSSVSDTSEGSPAADAAVSNQSSGLPSDGNSVQTQEPNSLSTADSSTESTENPNAVVQPISCCSDGQTISLGDISDSQGSSAKLSLDKNNYKAGDSAEVTVQDSDANVDPNVVNTVQIVVGQSKDDPSGQVLTLTETAPNSGEFAGTFTVNSDASKNKIFYDASHPRANVVINGVANQGSAEVTEIPVSSFQNTVGEGQPDVLIGNAIQVTLSDGAGLAPNSVCSDNGLPPPCGGSMTVSLSYANAPPDFNGQDPAAFTIWQHIDGVGWVDLRDFQDSGSIIVDENTKTVTANSPLGPGIFVIGVNTGAGGGGGGGAGLPGAGLILDLVAPLVDENSGSPGTTEPPTDNGAAVTTAIANNPSQASEPTPVSSVSGSTTGNSNLSSTQESLKTGGEVGQNTGSAPVSSTGSTTVKVPGAGDVVVSFTKLVSDGTLSVSAMKTPSELSALNIVASGNGQGTLTTLDNTRYSIAGYVFVVGPLDAKFDGTATVTIPYNATLAPEASAVKVLHYTGSSWEDVTANPPADGHVVTGSLDTLGPVVAAVKSQ